MLLIFFQLANILELLKTRLSNMSLVKKPDNDNLDPSNSKLVVKDTDETRPKRFVKVMDEDSYITVTN